MRGRIDMSETLSALEIAMRRDRVVVVLSLGVITLLAWLYLVGAAVAMSQGDMRLMGMGAMDMGAMPWTGATFALMFLMWWVMMVGMMVPSAAPMILLFARVRRKQLADDNPVLHTQTFALAYIVAWGVFSAVATVLQWGLSEALLLSAMMETTSWLLGAALFLCAGVYQLTPLKQACLRHCRSPADFLVSHWRKGLMGSFRMGLDHGVFCVGCCWFLMGLLFVGGVMNLAWVALLAAFVMAEKLLPRGELIGRVSGLAMIGVAVLLAARWSGVI